jgi:hypothetical protein
VQDEHTVNYLVCDLATVAWGDFAGLRRMFRCGMAEAVLYFPTVCAEVPDSFLCVRGVCAGGLGIDGAVGGVEVPVRRFSREEDLLSL